MPLRVLLLLLLFCSVASGAWVGRTGFGATEFPISRSDFDHRPSIAIVLIGLFCLTAVFAIVAKVRHDKRRLSIAEASGSQSPGRDRDVVPTSVAVSMALANLAESRNLESGGHLNRTAAYSMCLASALQSDPEYQNDTTDILVRVIGASSKLHDIGKVGIPDCVLKKPGKLNASEIAVMQTHPQIGANCIDSIRNEIGGSEVLDCAYEITLYHHERWDGGGYPFGIRGTQIPLSARIVTIADVYDALTSHRVYKKRDSHEEAVKIIQQGSGLHFDPHLVRVFLSVASQFEEIAISERTSEDQLASPPISRSLAF